MKIGTQIAQMTQISQIQSVFRFIRVYNYSLFPIH